MKKQTLYRVGWLIDGSGGKIRKNVGIQVEDGQIKAIHEMDHIAGNHFSEIDFSCFTVLPCLVDSHVHLFMSGTGDVKVREHQLSASFEEAKKVISDHVQQHLSYGILAVRDGGDHEAHALKYKNDSDKKSMPLSIKVAGRAWRKKGRYGRLIGRAPAYEESLAQGIRNDDTNVNHIKIVNSGLNSLKVFGKETPPQFSANEMHEAVITAKSKGKKVMVHANGKDPVRLAVMAGCHSIEHGFFMGKENLKLMAEKKVFWVPTAFTMKAYSRNLNPKSIEADIAGRNFNHQLEQIQTARELGVHMAVGTDAGSLGVHHGAGIIEELRIFIEAGFSIEDAIKCASYNGAKLLGLEKYGILKQGVPATFIVAAGDPSNLPGSLKDCHVYVFSEPL